MSQKISRKLLCFVVVLLCFAQRSAAQLEEGIAMPAVMGLPALTGVNLNVNSNNTTTYTNQGESAAKITNIITFRINENQPVYFAADFSADVVLDAELTDSSGTVSTRSINLKVRYDKASGAKYSVRDYAAFKDYRKVKIKIGQINITGGSGWDVKAALQVENEMRIIRYYNLSTTAAHLVPAMSTLQPTADVLEVKWSFPPDAQTGMSAAHENMTQLEWAYVESEMLDYYQNNPDSVFKNNSSRIDLDYSAAGYSFKIPLLYPGPGKLYYRARAVQRKSNGNIIAGNWSAVTSYSHAGHENSLNWQSSVSFSDAGKYKAVIQYFDGSLRGRQIVTKDNTTGNTIVGETIYDLQGRPGLQIVPTPTVDNTIKYFAGFNRFQNMGANEDPARYFDLTPAAINRCERSPALDTTAGNGRYYSANNDWLNTESKSKYIPGAQGYAYIETRFMDDATQRVRVQGGIGINHQINSGHEIKYYYGKPSQAELDALFGTEVGDASHYNKNMVRDPNGQMSVSYSDMHGRTIATALAGDPTPGIDSIINAADYPLPGAPVRNDLLTPATNLIDGNSIVSVSNILAPATTAYSFTYKLNPGILQLLNCNNETICFDCKYNLEISIKGENCGSEQPVIKRYNNLQLVAADAACNTSMGFVGEGITVPVTQINFDTTLTAGSYVIRKTLTINDSLFQIRRDSALHALLCSTRERLLDSVYTVLLSTSNCNASSAQACDSCFGRLGNFTQYKAKYLAAISPAALSDDLIYEQYKTDSVQCANSCNSGLNPEFATLKGLRAQLLSDMIPFTGQYAIDSVKNAACNGDLTRLEAKYNIFTQSYVSNGTSVSTGKPFYKKPQHENGSLFYYTADNLADSTIHGYNGGTVRIIDTINRSGFAGIFQDSWAASLIKYHPEYSKLQYAETILKTSYDWLDNSQNCLSWQTANETANNFINPAVSDPYFSLAGTLADKDTMNRRISVGIFYSGTSPSIWQIANGSVLCSTADSAHRYGCILQTKNDGIDPLITGTADKDKVWEKFRTVYLSYRNEMVLRYINNHAPAALSQSDMDKLISEGKQLAFARSQDLAAQNGITWWTDVSNTVPPDTTGIGTYIAGNGLDNCSGQRPFWKARLMQCEVLKQKLDLQTTADSVFVNNIINTILDSLVIICHNSLNPQQPYGASTVNPSYSGSPRRFEDVINNVLAANGIHTLPGDNYYCNPFSVDFPKPYGLNPAVSVNYVNSLDSCACKRFSILQAEASAAGYDAGSFSSMNLFLQTSYNDSLTLILWNGLQHCGNMWSDTCKTGDSPGDGGISGKVTCITPVIISIQRPPGSTGTYIHYLPQPDYNTCTLYMYDMSDNLIDQLVLDCSDSIAFLKISDTCGTYKFIIKSSNESCTDISSAATYYRGCKESCIVYTPIILGDFTVLPALFNCNYVKPCIDCNKLVNVLTGEFRSLYPAYNGVPYLTASATDEQAKQNTLWARFLNFRTGFSKSAMEYMGAYKNCGTNTQPGNVLCAFDRPLNDGDVFPPSYNPCRDVQTQAEFTADLLFESMKDAVLANFDSLYKQKCLNARYSEEFYVTSQPKEYHYALYYYDLAGNLVKTLPPAAVKPNYNTAYLAAVASARAAGSSYTNPDNNELLAAQYRYNSMGETVIQYTADAGTANFWYDRLGRPVISRDAKQAAEGKYSYTLYDSLGRGTQVGQKPQSAAMSQLISQDDAALQNWLSSGSLKEQITRTVYDVSYYDGDSLLSPAVLCQKNLRNNVSYTQVVDMEPSNGIYAGIQAAATYYSYDIHGNADTVVQDLNKAMANNPGNRYKKMVYNYDMVNGKVNEVSYQPGKTDQFYHKYNYDDEGRIVKVQTSHDDIYWETESIYEFYRHGSLSRSVIGQNQVQGIDYAYTIQGWLKGINSTAVQTAGTGNNYDIGRDGAPGGNTVARDAYGFSLNYFSGDYKPIGGAGIQPFADITNNLASASDNVRVGKDLFDGNIRAMLVNIPKLNESKLYGYRYDQLGRIKAMQSFNGINNATNQFAGNNPPAISEDYKERITYDPNGNIRTYLRNGSQSQPGGLNMDNLTYAYNKDAGGNLQNNRLRHIKDAIGNANYTEDIDGQPDDNYTYDAIGNLIADRQEGINNISWTAYGKIQSITKTNGTVINYNYDANGNRISKEVTANGVTKSTIYVRDGSGNGMSIYSQGDVAVNGGKLTQSEISLYGSHRLGVWSINRRVSNIGTTDYTNYSDSVVRGNKQYELRNHLDNVLVTISDKKLQVDGDNNGTPDYYTAEVITANDYYPFGMNIPGRTFAAQNQYRYGFNGQEKSDEIAPNTTTAEFWQYDARIGRRWNLDPKPGDETSPYACLANSPIWFTDPNGDTADLPGRTNGMNFYVMGTRKMRQQDRHEYGGGLKGFINSPYTWEYFKVKLMSILSFGKLKVIHASSPLEAINKIIKRLGSNSYVANLIISYHRGYFGSHHYAFSMKDPAHPPDTLTLNAAGRNLFPWTHKRSDHFTAAPKKESEKAFRMLADGGYADSRTTCFLANCWAGGQGNKGIEYDNTNTISEWLGGATVYGPQFATSTIGFMLHNSYSGFIGRKFARTADNKSGLGRYSVSFSNPFLFFDPHAKPIMTVITRDNIRVENSGRINQVRRKP